MGPWFARYFRLVVMSEVTVPLGASHPQGCFVGKSMMLSVELMTVAPAIKSWCAVKLALPCVWNR